jgi:RNAse (barnase) inhibitor barstar
VTTLLTPARSGVYRAPAHVEAVRHSADADALWIDIDLTNVSSKGELLDVFARAFGFPATFGRNWDALVDMLQDLSTRPASAWVLRLTHGSHAARVLGAEWATLLEVLAETAAYWKQHGKGFVVFIEDGAELPPWI